MSLREIWIWAQEFTPQTAFLRLGLAAVLGGVIGMERGRHGRAAGMRTHILVCLGSALTTLVGLFTVLRLEMSSDPLRAAAQVISGIGFLGVGTILIKDRFQVTGLTTAAGLWATAAIGLAVGVGFYEAALLTVLLVLVANALLPSLERGVKHRSASGHLYAEIRDVTCVNDFVELLMHVYQMEGLQVVPARSGTAGHVGLEIELSHQQFRQRDHICMELSKKDYVSFIVDSL